VRHQSRGAGGKELTSVHAYSLHEWTAEIRL
jgi:hypothetical protein